MRPSTWALALIGTMALASSSPAAPARPAPPPMASPRPLPLGAFKYMESCGGCHGLTGTSAKAEIPELRGQVGHFACTEEGRAYIVRLPNVAFSAMNDTELASAMNYMVFNLGAASTPKTARAYTAAEVAAHRRRPLKATDLAAMRTAVLGRAMAACAQSER